MMLGECRISKAVTTLVAALTYVDELSSPVCCIIEDRVCLAILDAREACSFCMTGLLAASVADTTWSSCQVFSTRTRTHSHEVL
jgi:hypothetical protein